MFDINFKNNNIEVMSIEREDIGEIYNWFKVERNQVDLNELDGEIDREQFYDRFIEYYLNECEFFTKVMIENELAGIFKGRIEFKNPNKVWLGFVLIGHKFRNKGIGTLVISSVINYFKKNYGIIKFYTILKENDTKSMSFWKRNGFLVSQPSSEDIGEKRFILKID